MYSVKDAINLERDNMVEWGYLLGVNVYYPLEINTTKHYVRVLKLTK